VTLNDEPGRRTQKLYLYGAVDIRQATIEKVLVAASVSTVMRGAIG
jgi:hypothetical protein